MPKILVIDYEHDDLIEISSSLKRLIPDSYVASARSGAEGIEKAKSESPDVILLATEIGDTDGFKICERLKSDEETKYVPVIMLTTGVTDPEIRVRGLQSGASAFLTRSGDEAELVAQVSALLRIKKAEEEKRELETMLQEARRMEVLGTLARGIAHDFNNSLTAIIGYAEIALSDAEKGTQMYDNLHEVLMAGNRARDLVKQLLAFNLQTGHEKKPLQISVIVKEALKMLSALLPGTIEIRQQIQADAGKALADPGQIHQMLIDICTNATHAMGEEGGVLEVNLADVDLDAHMMAQNPDLNPGPYLRLAVSGTGQGISPRDGAGVGLAVVHGIVKDHGGGIIVSSKPGRGTTLDIYLPRITGGVTPEKEVLTRFAGGKELILFIDDDQALAHLGKQMLERLGYEVISKTSSIEGLEAFSAKPDKFDLVITDFTMPNMTGLELSKKLLAIRPSIPIILCSGYSERVTKENAVAAGIREFVTKPIVIREIGELIRRVLGKKGH
jgi:CheY-like chemotaxis protein